MVFVDVGIAVCDFAAIKQIENSRVCAGGIVLLTLLFLTTSVNMSAETSPVSALQFSASFEGYTPFHLVTWAAVLYR